MISGLFHKKHISILNINNCLWQKLIRATALLYCPAQPTLFRLRPALADQSLQILSVCKPNKGPVFRLLCKIDGVERHVNIL